MIIYICMKIIDIFLGLFWWHVLLKKGIYVVKSFIHIFVSIFLVVIVTTTNYQLVDFIILWI